MHMESFFLPKIRSKTLSALVLIIATTASIIILPISGIMAQTTTQTSEEMERRDRAVEASDIEILKRTRNILADETVWDRADDRVCDEGDTTWSLFCALYKASIEIAGEYDHRRVALQEVRFAIEDVSGGQEFDHRLKDFNNQKDMTLKGIHEVIDIALNRTEARLTPPR